MKKLFSHQRLQNAPSGALGFQGALAGGGAHGLLPGASRALSFKVKQIGVIATPKMHHGNVPLGAMRPASSPLQVVAGYGNSLKTRSSLSRGPKGGLFK